MLTISQQVAECKRKLRSAKTKVRRRDLLIELKALITRQIRVELRKERIR